MPTVLRFDGLRVVLYPNDHRPAHVRVKGAKGGAVFVLNCPAGPPRLRDSFGFSCPELGRIEADVAWRCSAPNGRLCMAITDEEFASAETRMAALREAGHAASARYDRRTGRIVVMLHTGIQLAVPSRLLERLAGAAPSQLAEIEVSPSDLGLHWPKLDADVYLPALLGGMFGSRRWMAELGAATRPDAGAAARRSAGA